LAGVQLLAPPIAVVVVGSIPATGSLSSSLPLGLLPAGVEGVTVYGQAVLLTPAGALRLCSGSGVSVLDATQ
jgi:hypothetical protein